MDFQVVSIVSQTIPRHHVCQSLVGRTPIPGETETPSFMPNFHTPNPDAATNVVHSQSTPRSRFERDPPYDFRTIQGQNNHLPSPFPQYLHPSAPPQIIPNPHIQAQNHQAPHRPHIQAQNHQALHPQHQANLPQFQNTFIPPASQHNEITLLQHQYLQQQEMMKQQQEQQQRMIQLMEIQLKSQSLDKEKEKEKRQQEL